MTAPKVLFMPAGLAAFICCLVVTSLFSASGAIGWYYVWGEPLRRASDEAVSDIQCPVAHQRTEPYKSEDSRAAIIAGIQGGLCALIVGESLYG